MMAYLTQRGHRRGASSRAATHLDREIHTARARTRAAAGPNKVSQAGRNGAGGGEGRSNPNRVRNDSVG